MTRRIPKESYAIVKSLVESQSTIDQAKAYLNHKLREMKAQPGTPPRTPKKGKGFTRPKAKGKAQAKPEVKSRATKKEIVYVPQLMIQPMTQYRPQPTYAPVPQPQPQPQPQPLPQPQPQPVATGSGKHRRQKAASRLKPIKEEEEEVLTVIKPARNHLPHLGIMNDLFLVNKVRGKKDFKQIIMLYLYYLSIDIILCE